MKSGGGKRFIALNSSSNERNVSTFPVHANLPTPIAGNRQEGSARDLRDAGLTAEASNRAGTVSGPSLTNRLAVGNVWADRRPQGRRSASDVFRIPPITEDLR